MMNRKLIFMLLTGILLSGAIQAQPKQGQLAAEIALPTANGDTLRLSSLRGKVVLLDFWASWCGPCRVANRGLSKIYEKFRGKGFEIFSISFDHEKEEWIKAIKQDKIKWMQVNEPNEPGNWNGKVALHWNIFGLPTTYLIDRDGTLLAMDLEGKQLENALKELIDK